MKKNIIIVLTLALVMTFITGCQKQEPEKLTLGVMADVGAVPFMIAKEQNFFEDQGLDVEIQVFRSALDRDAALQTGALDGAMADMLTIFFYQQSGFDVKMTSQTFGDYIMVSAPEMTDETFLNTDEINIGLSSNTVIDFATEQIASKLDFDSQLNKVAIPQMPVRLQLLDSGELTGATLPDPLAAAAKLSGTHIGSTSELGLYPGIFIMNNNVLNDNADAVKKMYDAYNEAIEYLNNTDMEVFFPVLEEQLGFPSVLKDTYVMPVYTKAEAPDTSTYNITQEWMKDMELIKDTYNYDDVSDLQFIQ